MATPPVSVPTAGLAKVRFISVTTFKRDGTPVSVPVWCAGSESSMSVAARCSRPASARSNTPERICTLARDDTARATAPRSSLVWVDYDGDCACVNTTRERRKGGDMEADPRVSLLVVDPADTGRFILIRGHAELVEKGAVDELDRLTRRYTRHPRYYGYIYPDEQATRETRITCRIHPDKVTLDAIHH